MGKKKSKKLATIKIQIDPVQVVKKISRDVFTDLKPVKIIPPKKGKKAKYERRKFEKGIDSGDED